ncbi:MAG: sigma-54-dependent Fis family transcriptional regulator [Steroidobacteraceae bacterium]|jgi:transcriptional regulator of acetoin/glycerol metabolism
MTTARQGPHADLVLKVAGCSALPEVVTALTPTVDLSWRRCLNEFKLDPARDYQPTVLDRSRVQDLQAEHQDLVEIARAEMDSLYEQIAGSGYALLLADTDGVILCEKVDPTLKGLFTHAGLIVGAEWSEQREGTNGIGTCAKEARPITIHQADHFRSRHVGLSCSAAPIRDSNGRVVAVLDASSVNDPGSRESKMHTVALVATSARLIEKCLFLRRHRADAMLRFHFRPEFVDLLHDGAIAVAADGTIVASDATGLKLLGAADRSELVGRSITEVFDASYEELVAALMLGRRTMRELRDNQFGRRYYASLVEPEAQTSRAPSAGAQAARTVVRVAPGVGAAAMSLADLAGDDPQMLRNLRNARRIADSNVSVLIAGPTGSGKEAFARALHFASKRAAHAFVAINCAAIPETLIESELFGYAPGAFTGARREGMRGRIVQSSGGTLFLDEIGDMPLLLQTRLLRVLEDEEVTPLGSEASIKVNLRVLCASHRNLLELLERGEFREDLYYRLNGITMELPPLAARRDKEAIVRGCIARESAGMGAASIEKGALEKLLAYDWPGNIRELRNSIRTALALCSGRVIRLGDLPQAIRQGRCARRGQEGAPARGGGVAVQCSLEHAEREVLLGMIAQHRWNMSQVAAQLGISRNTLYRKIKRHGIVIDRRPGG